MGKKDKKKTGKGAEKTAEKTEKKATLKRKKELIAKGEDDIEKVIAEIQEYDRQRLEVIEEVGPPPSPRSSFTLTAHPDRDELILYGGEYCNGKKTFVYGNLFFYSIKKDRWTSVQIPGSPPPRCSHQAVALQQSGGQLWIFGGEFSSPTQLQFHHYRDLWVLHLQTRKWEKINANGGPSARSGHRMVASKKQLIVFGGFNDNTRECRYYNDAFAFNLDAYTWARLECSGRAPSPRSGCQMAALSDNRILVHGGYSKEPLKRGVERGITHSDMFIFQPEKSDLTGSRWRWSSLKQSGPFRPSPRCGFSLVPVPDGSLANRAFLFGGVFDTEEDEESLRGTFFDELYQLDLEKGSWNVVGLVGASDAATKKPRRNKVKDIDVAGGDDESAAIDALKLDDGSTVVTQEVKTFDDGIFSVTIGAQNSYSSEVEYEGGASSRIADASGVDVNTPHSRMNCGLAIKHGVLYLYGGIYEDGDRTVTLSDFHKLDIHKLDRWQTMVKCDIERQEWLDSSSESGSDEEEEDGDDEDVDDRENLDLPADNCHASRFSADEKQEVESMETK